MGFSGKPSKGCLPCRQKRTKCDLALPACTQCLRKKRMCFGYRNEQDMVFRNETGLVIRKVKRKSSEDEDSPPEDAYAVARLDPNALMQHPSRRATLQDEALMHWLNNFNEKHFNNHSKQEAGFEYILPVYRGDLTRGGPVVEIVHACGLAALGNAKGSPDLLRAARIKQINVLGQLKKQLHNPDQALTDSSILTCLLLSSFENIICEGDNSMAAATTHLKGASTLIRLRGKSQFSDRVGRGIFTRLQGSMLALCLITSEELPEYFYPHVEEMELKEGDFEAVFYVLMGRVCKLRAQHKRSGYVDEAMVHESNQLLKDFETWDPNFPPWVLPPGHRSFKSGTGQGMKEHNVDNAHRLIWVAMGWILIQTAHILIHELLITYYRASLAIAPSSAAEKSLQDSITAQINVVSDVKDAVGFYLGNFELSPASTRGVGAHMLMMPLSILLTASTTDGETYAWILTTSSKIAEVFALKQGKMVADFLMMGIKANAAAAANPAAMQVVSDANAGGSSMESPESGSGSGSGSKSEAAGELLPSSNTGPQQVNILIS